MKQKITTKDEKIYSALNRLKYEKEVTIDKPFDYKIIDRILQNNTNIIAVSNGRQLILKKINDVKYDVYLNKIWS